MLTSSMFLTIRPCFIAGALALGHRVSEIKEFYFSLAPSVFKRRWRRIPELQAKFDAGALSKEIARIIGSRKLDSLDLRTGLAIVAKRIDTGSPWILCNNPNGAFWNITSDNAIPNKDYELSTLVRASTAAPTFFDPEIIAIAGDAPNDPLAKISDSFGWAPSPIRFFGTKLRALYGRLLPHLGPNEKTHGLFIDGGVTPYNNPVVLLLMLVTLKQFGICWNLGPENVTIVSIGTGAFRPKLSFNEGTHFLTGQLTLAERAILSCIHDGQDLALALMQWLGECPMRRTINGEIHDVAGNTPLGGPWFRFLRYDVSLDAAGVGRIDEQIDEHTVHCLQRIYDAKMIETLYAIGEHAARQQVKVPHLLGLSNVSSAFQRDHSGAARE